MSFSIRIEGLEEVRRTLDGFSKDRLRATLSTTLTRTARDIEGDWVGEIFTSIDRPTKPTATAVGVKTATAQTLTAEVFIKDQSPGADTPPPVAWLTPQEYGGGRFVKKFEQALMAQGAMPRGFKVVPGKHAQLDQFGNISRGQITHVLTQLGGQLTPGYQRTISKNTAKRMATAQRHRRSYVAITKRQGRLSPGVYMRVGRNLLPVFFYVSAISYDKRTDFDGTARKGAAQHLATNLERAFNEQLGRLATKLAGASK